MLKDLKRDNTLKDLPVIVMTNSLNPKEMLERQIAHESDVTNKAFGRGGNIYKKFAGSAEKIVLETIFKNNLV